MPKLFSSFNPIEGMSIHDELVCKVSAEDPHFVGLQESLEKGKFPRGKPVASRVALRQAIVSLVLLEVGFEEEKESIFGLAELKIAFEVLLVTLLQVFPVENPSTTLTDFITSLILENPTNLKTSVIEKLRAGLPLLALRGLYQAIEESEYGTKLCMSLEGIENARDKVRRYLENLLEEQRKNLLEE